MIFDEKDFVTINGYDVMCNLGTDDQVLIVWNSKRSKEQLDADLKSYFEERSLGGEVTDHMTVFGMDFGETTITPSKTLGLAKLFLLEKTVNGDAMALKMTERLKHLPDYFDTIQECMIDHKFGNLSSYKKGAENCMHNLAKYGFPIDGLINIYSPVENLLYGDLLKKSSYSDPLCSKRYSEEQMKPLYDTFIKYFQR